MPRKRLSRHVYRDSRAERYFLKLSLGILLGFILLVVLIWGGWAFYLSWQEKRLVQKAETALEQGDAATASLAARAALQLKSDSADAARIAAAVAERRGDQSAVLWRQKVVQSKDHSVEDLLALARAALQFNDLAMAKSALARLREADRETVGFHAVSAMIAQAEHQNDKAATEWEQTVKLSPQEKSYQLQLGAALLRLKDASRREAGSTILNGLRADPKYRIAATRTLISESVAHGGDARTILQLARELGSDPEAAVSDKILVADLLRQANDPQFASFLTELEKTAATQAEDLAALLSWMSQTNLNVLALDFMRTLKPDLLQRWPVPLAVADVYVRLQEWSKLEAQTKSGDWRGLEFLRCAYLSRALREQNKAAAKGEWSAAVKGAATSDQVMTLLRTISGWGWQDEQIDLLWALTKFPAKEKEALQNLYSYYLKKHDAHGLYRVLLRLAEQHPDDLDVQNNLAQVSLLLEAKTEDARRTAAEIYRKQPNNAAYATTYAYALLTKGDTKGAAKVMSMLTEEQLKDPAIGAYYGICLAALNDPRARQFLEAGEKAQLLPEEKSLLEKARNGLETRNPE